MTMLTAGHETTAAVLIYLLAQVCTNLQNPEKIRKTLSKENSILLGFCVGEIVETLNLQDKEAECILKLIARVENRNYSMKELYFDT